MIDKIDMKKMAWRIVGIEPNRKIKLFNPITEETKVISRRTCLFSLVGLPQSILDFAISKMREWEDHVEQ